MFPVEDILKYFVEDCDLQIFPVHSVDENCKCTCRNKETCRTPGKHPFLNFGWKKLATNNLEKFNKMAGKRSVNYAVITGQKSSKTGKYLVVVDVDQVEHEIIKSLPRTFSYRTGSGGYHFWYWSDVPVSCSYSGVASKVDIKGSSGYVIVPPSKHKSGKFYELIYGLNEPIVDLPKHILDMTKKSHDEMQKSRRPRKPKKKNLFSADVQVADPIFESWHKNPIADVKAKIDEGVKIPSGVRNITIHRMLSSHRAKGVATYEDLMALAVHYKACLENPETFDDKELRGIVVSVMRYPVYNSSSENVNKNYCKWLEKKGIKNDLEMVEQVDSLFFSSLKPGKTLVSLAWVAEKRKSWYQSHDIKDFATYKSQLLAEKLRSLGFTRTRTSKANLWNIDTNENVLAQAEETCEDVSNRRDTMATKKKSKSVEEVAVSEPVVEAAPVATPVEGSTEEDTAAASGNGPIGPDGLPLTLIETREDIITTDRKYNPDDFKYNGMQQSSQDLLMAQIKLFEKLSPEQEADYEAGTLVYDEERTRDFMDAIQVGDIVGIKNTMYSIKKIDADSMIGCPRGYNKYDRKYHFDTEEETISLVDLDNALTMGFGQILYRNDKPFGLDDEMTYKVIVKVYADSVGRTYVFKGGREVVKHTQPESKNDTATTGKDSA